MIGKKIVSVTLVDEYVDKNFVHKDKLRALVERWEDSKENAWDDHAKDAFELCIGELKEAIRNERY